MLLLRNTRLSILIEGSIELHFIVWPYVFLPRKLPLEYVVSPHALGILKPVILCNLQVENASLHRGYCAVVIIVYVLIVLYPQTVN